jgi:trans-aconitate methyltransferase
MTVGFACVAHHHHDAATDWSAAADLMELEGEVLRPYLDDVTTWVSSLVGDCPRRVLDIGCGPGAGSLALAQRFEEAEVVAVDASADLLARLRAKAVEVGVAPRVRITQVDLDQGWPDVEPVDLAWASLSLHHLADPDRVLADIFASLHPGGVLAVAEMKAPLWLLPDDLGLDRPGLAGRCHPRLAKP